ncbi:hypothetical protein V2G26_004355 [Clonostachys chloroleuca]
MSTVRLQSDGRQENSFCEEQDPPRGEAGWLGGIISDRLHIKPGQDATSGQPAPKAWPTYGGHNFVQGPRREYDPIQFMTGARIDDGISRSHV